MTYNVFSGTLGPAQSVNESAFCCGQFWLFFCVQLYKYMHQNLLMSVVVA